MPDGGPLAGTTILAVEQFGAGPLATLYLSDLGATVIKIEDPRSGGDIGRYVPPGHIDTNSLYFEAFNRGKKSVLLDLRSIEGARAFRGLAKRADAVFNNLRGDLPTTLGLTYQELSKLNRRVVCVSLSGYGRSGSRAANPGYDALVQAEAGWAAITGEPGGPPVKSGLSLADYVAGLMAAIITLGGLYEVRATGLGRDLDVNLYDSALAMMTYPAAWFLSIGEITTRQSGSGHPSIVPFQFFATSDGFLAVACPKQKFFDVLVASMGMPELSGAPLFRDFEARSANRTSLVRILADRFTTKTTGEWVSLLSGRVPVAPVDSLPVALDRERLIEREMLATYSHPVLGEVATLGSPLFVSGWRPEYSRAPLLGEHTVACLRAAGVSASDIREVEIAAARGTSVGDVRMERPGDGRWLHKEDDGT